MIVLNRTLWILLAAQISLCVLSPGFSPAILGAIALMVAAPVCFLRSMEARGVAFLVLPCMTGLLLFQGLLLNPVFLAWFVLVVAASVYSWNRGPGKPQLLSNGP